MMNSIIVAFYLFDIMLILLALYCFAAVCRWVRFLPITGYDAWMARPIHLWIGLLAVNFAMLLSPIWKTNPNVAWVFIAFSLFALVSSIVWVCRLEKIAKRPTFNMHAAD